MIGLAVVFLSAAALLLVFEVGRRVWWQEMAGRCGFCEGSGRAFGLEHEDWCEVCTGSGRR